LVHAIFARWLGGNTELLSRCRNRSNSRFGTLQRFGAPADEEILAKLRQHKGALRARGVRHAALFGSYARGDNRRGSDIDIMIEIDPDIGRI
jgi:hypothetical protein